MARLDCHHKIIILLAFFVVFDKSTTMEVHTARYSKKNKKYPSRGLSRFVVMIGERREEYGQLDCPENNNLISHIF